ncbi:MAG: hypothetical protein SWO11_04590 [Thermodesulfobacteriota bacterium]|nr:hypothetical protein [Thermodesulfobacteriota bacterium]
MTNPPVWPAYNEGAGCVFFPFILAMMDSTPKESKDPKARQPHTNRPMELKKIIRNRARIPSC